MYNYGVIIYYFLYYFSTDDDKYILLFTIIWSDNKNAFRSLIQAAFTKEKSLICIAHNNSY
jgi:hypothetical protein